MTLLVHFSALFIGCLKKRREKIVQIFLTDTDALIDHSNLYTNRIKVVADYKLLHWNNYLAADGTELDRVLN